MNKEEYYELLLHPKWRAKRLLILERDNYTCLLCKSKENLQVHHQYYIWGNKPWQYPNECLMTVCRSCHVYIHQELEIPIKSAPKPKSSSKRKKGKASKRKAKHKPRKR